MIRVAILADTELRARNLAGLLSEDERLDVIEARAIPADRVRPAASSSTARLRAVEALVKVMASI